MTIAFVNSVIKLYQNQPEITANPSILSIRWPENDGRKFNADKVINSIIYQHNSIIKHISTTTFEIISLPNLYILYTTPSVMFVCVWAVSCFLFPYLFCVEQPHSIANAIESCLLYIMCVVYFTIGLQFFHTNYTSCKKELDIEAQ